MSDSTTTWPAYVYIVVSMSGLVKIGTSKTPEKRFKNLQTGSPEDLILYQIIGCPSNETAIGLELILHDRYKEYLRRDEWFDIDPDTVIEDVAFAIEVNTLMVTDRSPRNITRKQVSEWIQQQPAHVQALHPKELCKLYMQQEHGFESEAGYKTFERAKQELGL